MSFNRYLIVNESTKPITLNCELVDLDGSFPMPSTIREAKTILRNIQMTANRLITQCQATLNGNIESLSEISSLNDKMNLYRNIIETAHIITVELEIKSAKPVS
jgi:hypothetical protein